MLNTVSYPSPDNQTPALIVHGLFGSARNWGAIAKKLSASRPVLAVDMRNHGDSFRAATHSYSDMASDLAEVIAAHGGRADVIGHSMGGKAAMQLALTDSGCVNKLVIADIAPVAYAHTQTHLIDAIEALDVTALTSRRDADDAMAQTVPEAGVRAFLLQSLDMRADPPAWKLNHKALRADMPKILSWPGTEGQFTGETLVISGGASDYVTPAHRPLFDAQFPNAQFEVVPGVGHWLHAEAPGPFLSALTAFLDA
jgi:esterase